MTATARRTTHHAGEPVPPQSVTCDQAVFTSVPSPMGSGYRIVAASPGLRPEEKQHIITRCPSHEGLCSDAPDATAVSFYPLPGGRFCVAHTCNAGLEHTGRGGRCIYTRVAILDAEGFAVFAWNPFDVCRSLLEATGPEPQLSPPAVLPALQLQRRPTTDPAQLSRCVARLGLDWLADIVGRAMQREQLIVLGDLASPTLLEAVVLSLPALLRARTSFSAGLRHSLSRDFDLAAVDDPNPDRLRRMLQGHDVALLEPQSEGDQPRPVDCDWALMARRDWQQDRPGELFAFTAGHFPDQSLESLRRYARLRTRRDQLADLSPGGILDLLAVHLPEPVTDELAASLAIAVTAGATAKLTDFFSTASIDELAKHWETAVNLWRQSQSTTSLLASLVGTMLRRGTRLHPPTALELGIKLVQAIEAGAPLEPVRQPLDDLLDHLAEWVYDQPPRALARLVPALRRWPRGAALGQRAQQVAAQLAARCLVDA